MAFVHAGRWGPEPFIDVYGNIVPGAQVYVYVGEDLTELATLYSDRLKSQTATNPTFVDGSGNLDIFADPGEYTTRVVWHGQTIYTRGITVPVDPEDTSGGNHTHFLDEFADVHAPTPGDGDVVVWVEAENRYEARPIDTGVNDHGGLTGLGDDDHPQYAKADGTRGQFETHGAVAEHRLETEAHPQYARVLHGVPTGAILAWTTQNPPDGFLVCEGQAVLRTQFAGLFSILGTTFGAGDGSTTFNLPDLRERFVSGARTVNRPIGTVGGSANHGHTASGGGGGSGTTGSAGAHGHTGSGNVSIGFAGDHGHSGSSSVSVGAGGSHNHGMGVGTSGTYSMNRTIGNYSSSHAGSHGHNSNINASSNHNHSASASVSINSGGSHNHSGSASLSVDGVGNHEHSFSVSVAAPTVQDGTNLPPFVALAYIIKV